MTIVDLSVCVTCQHAGEPLGAAMHQELSRTFSGCDNVQLHAVECMSVCTRPCTLSVSSRGKWTYIIGDLQHTDKEAIIEYIKTYAASPHGTPPLKERPAAIRRGTIARLSPLTQKKDMHEDA